MTGNELLKSAQSTAKTFHEEFPGEISELSWLAEAASIERVPDEQLEEWFQAFRDEARALRLIAEEVRP